MYSFKLNLTLEYVEYFRDFLKDLEDEGFESESKLLQSIIDQLDKQIGQPIKLAD